MSKCDPESSVDVVEPWAGALFLQRRHLLRQSEVSITRSAPVNFSDQRELDVFEDAAAWWRPGINLIDPGLDPVRVNTIEVSGNLFDLLGVRPQIGAGLPAGGPLFVNNELVAVISDRLWRTRYSADPSIVGKQLSFNDTPYTILGVMPAGFTIRTTSTSGSGCAGT